MIVTQEDLCQHFYKVKISIEVAIYVSVNNTSKNEVFIPYCTIMMQMYKKESKQS